MGKSFQRLLLMVICLFCLPLLLGKQCFKAEDGRVIMIHCLRNYTLGFNNLGKFEPGQEPPSCEVDLGLAQCLSESRCFSSFTNNLRILILNQLVFTKRSGICKKNVFEDLLKKAEDGFDLKWPAHAEALKKVLEMRNMQPEICATLVYATCGRRFKERLQNFTRFDPNQLCRVFKDEGQCIANRAEGLNCTNSALLERFKTNSEDAAESVLASLCPPPTTP